ncbi:hypothetical protein A3K86_19855 [Photobacterium jeanii]|uniref:DUF4381 domain-containing protein n=1 Tax=Photobacterium jeanii TaxID=858640 RepID=A0A178K2N1_9GAMM|nr:DUF4381 domain-containing protein [Photobacterium jeanii]OAN11215.1 hypothetical protein A3K86_19855 [Photobacterium jeanii]PST90735.1 DUF4381 domain-containing protein [Photobacterium jeanii]
MPAQSSPALPLADIILPTPPSAWQLAWGWWVLITLVIVTLILTVWQLHRYKKQRLAQKAALTQLALYQQDDNLKAINTLLRQAALSYFPRQEVASLHGHAWLAFLDQHLKGKQAGFVAQQEIWQRGLFSPQGLSSQEQQVCFKLAKRWLTEALPPKKIPQATTSSKSESPTSDEKAPSSSATKVEDRHV